MREGELPGRAAPGCADKEPQPLLSRSRGGVRAHLGQVEARQCSRAGEESQRRRARGSFAVNATMIWSSRTRTAPPSHSSSAPISPVPRPYRTTPTPLPSLSAGTRLLLLGPSRPTPPHLSRVSRATRSLPPNPYAHRAPPVWATLVPSISLRREPCLTTPPALSRHPCAPILMLPRDTSDRHPPLSPYPRATLPRPHEHHLAPLRPLFALSPGPTQRLSGP